MAKTFEDALAALESDPELVEAVKVRLAKVNDEARGLRERAKAAESAKTKLDKVLKELEITESDDESLDAKIVEIKNIKSNSKPASEFSALEKRLKNLEAERDSAKQSARQAKLDSELAKLLHDNNVSENVFGGLKDVLSLKAKSKDDGSFYFDDGGQETTLADGVKTYLTNNSGFVKNVQSNGSGGRAGTTTEPQTFTLADWNGLPHEKRAELVKQDIKII